MTETHPNKRAGFGVIGLGRMGGGLALQALEKGWPVAGYTRGPVPAELVKRGLTPARGLKDLKDALARPRVVLLYVPAGKAVDELLAELCRHLETGDIVVDGGNSYWGDSRRRWRRMRDAGLRFVDLGTSGGVSGARRGACFMAGGTREAVRALEPLLRDLSVPGGYVHAGPPGAGHFVKLVHNGIEFGMLEAIGEGIELLDRWPGGRLPTAGILDCWRNGSVIRSWLIDLMRAAITGSADLSAVPSYVEDTGEVNWLVSDAMHLEVPIPVIAQSVMQLIQSRDAARLASRAVALMRRGFGDHPLGPSERIARERRGGRLSDAFLAPESEPAKSERRRRPWKRSAGGFGPYRKATSPRPAGARGRR